MEQFQMIHNLGMPNLYHGGTWAALKIEESDTLPSDSRKAVHSSWEAEPGDV